MMVTVLNPRSPRNEKLRAYFDDSWQNAQVMKRIRGWRLAGLAILSAPITGFAALGLTELFGIDKWFTSINIAFYIFLYWYALPRLLRKGWFPWLLNREQPTAIGK